MNQNRLNFFLKFAEHHPLNWSTPHYNTDIEYCGPLDCDKCVHTKDKTCGDAFLSDDEFEFIKLNYPEYFL